MPKVNAKFIHHPLLCMINGDFAHKPRCTCYSFGFWVLCARWCFCDDVVSDWLVAMRRAFYSVPFFVEQRRNDKRSAQVAEFVWRFWAILCKKRNHQCRCRFVGIVSGWICVDFSKVKLAFRMTNHSHRLCAKIQLVYADVRFAPIFYTKQKLLGYNDVPTTILCRIWRMIFAPEKCRTESIVATTSSETYRKR